MLFPEIILYKRLEKLIETGADRGLLISATGTGKTYASAFGVRDALQPQGKVLFIVHRKQILREDMLRMQHVLRIKSERMSSKNLAYEDRLSRLMRDKRITASKRLELLAARLDGLSPLKKISGGYGYITDGSGHAVLSAESVRKGDSLTVFVRDGRIGAIVTSTEKLEL